jgi:DNA-binding NarL/FixJ family response regulator
VSIVSIRVALVEDHPLVIDGMRAALAGHEGISVVGAATTLAGARELLRTTACDIVLLDIRLPDGSGIDLLQDNFDTPGGPAFLVLSSFLTPEYVAAAMALGASGFLLKTSPADEIVAAVEAIAAGGLAYTREQLRAGRPAVWAPLTHTEHAVLAGVVGGQTNDELSAATDLSRKTVESYVSRLMLRFGAASRTELAVATERGMLLDLPTRPNRQRRR